MSKFIGVKMIEAVPMTAREANDKGYRIGNHSFEELGKQYAMEKVVNDLWAHLGFVLQWAKDGLKK